jgi:hypothetical protein
MSIVGRAPEGPPLRVLHTGNMYNGHFQALIPVGEQPPEKAQYISEQGCSPSNSDNDSDGEDLDDETGSVSSASSARG